MVHKNKVVGEKMKLQGNMNESMKMTHMADIVSECRNHVMGELDLGSESVQEGLVEVPDVPGS